MIESKCCVLTALANELAEFVDVTGDKLKIRRYVANARSKAAGQMGDGASFSSAQCASPAPSDVTLPTDLSSSQGQSSSATNVAQNSELQKIMKAETMSSRTPEREAVLQTVHSKEKQW